MKCLPCTSPSFMIKVIDPESEIVIKWRRFIGIMGVASLILDPFFLYVPSADGPKCLGNDLQAVYLFAAIRTLLDFLHLLHIVLKFRMAFQRSGPRVFRSRNLIMDPLTIAIRYFKSRFIFDLVTVLPLPQIIIWTKASKAVADTLFPDLLSSFVLVQFSLRIVTIVPYKLFSTEAGLFRRNIWSGAVFNLFIYILIGHFVGALYYRLYLNKIWDCLSTLSREELNTVDNSANCRQVHNVCVSKYTELDKGIFSDAFSNEISLRSFTQRSIYCFVWGVRSLSSLGQIFDATFDVLETAFSCVVIIVGLVLLADLIARMQASVQSAGARREQQRIKQRRLEEWTHYHDLSSDLKRIVRQNNQSEWQCTKGIEDENILNSLPLDLRCDIRTHLYKERVANIPPFSRMDEPLLDFICGHLRTFTKAEGTYIVLQGDPLDQVVFIFTGLLQLTTHHGCGRSTSRNLEAGDFFGDDLLTWASQPNSSTQNLPPSNVTVKCISNVEAFCLPAEHLRLLVVFNYIHRFQRALREHHA